MSKLSPTAVFLFTVPGSHRRSPPEAHTFAPSSMALLGFREAWKRRVSDCWPKASVPDQIWQPCSCTVGSSRPVTRTKLVPGCTSQPFWLYRASCPLGLVRRQRSGKCCPRGAPVYVRRVAPNRRRCVMCDFDCAASYHHEVIVPHSAVCALVSC